MVVDMSGYRLAESMAEGWILSEVLNEVNDAGEPKVQIQRLDTVGIFDTDEDAWKHVVARAREGSEHHLWVLNKGIDNEERKLIRHFVGDW